ncbi:MAG: hypothetical protein H6636_05165 [Anaerolineales bacterium]|nr:hypothetical protein [Anaerolineales bacterium]
MYKFLVIFVTGLIVILLGITMFSMAQERVQNKAGLAVQPTFIVLIPTETKTPTPSPTLNPPTLTPSPTTMQEVPTAVQFPGTIFLPFIQVSDERP